VKIVAFQAAAGLYRAVGYCRLGSKHIRVALPAAIGYDLPGQLTCVGIVALGTILGGLDVRDEGHVFLRVVGMTAGTQLHLGFPQDGRLLTAVAGVAQQALLDRDRRM
jgi:hypothetical protein